ncbi:ABC transporter G family member 45-like isoform X1 [Panicum miliaceum]|uniref:ABC transporter G family member 45-like isoform X1 n=1 Tax=Panicum miliaceum TaxID=4540 RepID=A0A3L6T6H3_PANMI|nr:ABC transporter G family member 45-like isoform X1 [Panicum miliaceum]
MAAVVREEAPPLTHAENEEFLRMLRDVRQWYCGGHMHLSEQSRALSRPWACRVGREPPEKVEVVFDGVSVEAEERVGRRALPTLPNVVFNGVKAIVDSANTCAAQKRTFKIIKQVSGTIRPSRMTLVLGAPGSGKTTFLRALAGKLDSSLKMQGKVFYNGKSSPSTPHHLCSYVSQHDLHHAEMIATKLGEGSNLKTNYIIKILGLCDCADTIVGDALRRGISGGQKKRTTIGEMLVGRAKCFFMDDVSTGLDSSTTFGIMTFLRQMTYLMDLTMVCPAVPGPIRDASNVNESVSLDSIHRKNTDDLQPWLHWGYWASPFTYYLNAVALNEFFDKRWATQMRKHGATEDRLQLLRDVSGAFRPGVLTALMGITGAGKTTLLDVLAGRKTGGYIEGTIHVPEEARNILKDIRLLRADGHSLSLPHSL